MAAAPSYKPAGGNSHRRLVPIGPNRVGGETIATVNARDLHAALMVGRDFPTWITDRIAEYGFIEGRDFCSPVSGSKAGRGGHNAKEYFLSLDMAKELGMVGGELRILDVDLAARLGFERPRNTSRGGCRNWTGSGGAPR